MQTRSYLYYIVGALASFACIGIMWLFCTDSEGNITYPVLLELFQSSKSFLVPLFMLAGGSYGNLLFLLKLRKGNTKLTEHMDGFSKALIAIDVIIVVAAVVFMVVNFVWLLLAICLVVALFFTIVVLKSEKELQGYQKIE